jgi:PAS domain S-box-containing protein
MIHPDDRDRALQNIKRNINGENVYGEKYRVQRKDGTIFPVIIYGDRIIKDKQVVGLRGIIVDITDQKKAEEARQKAEK